MGKSKVKFKEKPTETQLVFKRLMSDMTSILAPRLIGLMEEFGYEMITLQMSSRSANITIQELRDMSTPDMKFWKKRYPVNMNKEAMHNDLLLLFKKYKSGTEHLMAIRSAADKALDWTGKIGSVGQRRVITEKFRKSEESSQNR